MDEISFSSHAIYDWSKGATFGYNNLFPQRVVAYRRAYSTSPALKRMKQLFKQSSNSGFNPSLASSRASNSLIFALTSHITLVRNSEAHHKTGWPRPPPDGRLACAVSSLVRSAAYCSLAQTACGLRASLGTELLAMGGVVRADCPVTSAGAAAMDSRSLMEGASGAASSFVPMLWSVL